ncbi:phosphotransferase [Pigmentiphaga aceris]|uniref:Phosphotransferase n=2 Tax=Pigmentiphaga aceris TaxID=1940612 RepID=A0A5C0B864_9BURK|nr:phosphotransferase [Pigmentiphaga aceris]
MDEDEAIALARSRYGIQGKVTRFATEKDDTFRVEAADGRRFILKVANPSEDVSEISLQAELLQHIAQVDPDLPVPRILPDDAGRAYAQITDRAGQARQVRLMSYLDGTPLDSTASSPAEREQVGEVLGRLRHATAGFSHAADTRVLAWDVKHLQSLRPLLDDVSDPHQRAVLTAGMARFASIESRLAALPMQVLHNDFSRSNIVVDHALPAFVTGIIDFGDAVRTAVAIDVSTALLNQLPRDAAEHPVNDLFADGKDLLRGYLRQASLSDEELALVPHLVMGRAVARALITLWRARLFPQNATYILRNTEPGWAQLDWFLARSMDEVSGTLLNTAA